MPQGEEDKASDAADQRGDVDILRAATDGSGTMNGGDFRALSRIAAACASYFKVSVDSISGIYFTVPAQTSILSVETRRGTQEETGRRTWRWRREDSSQARVTHRKYFDNIL